MKLRSQWCAVILRGKSRQVYRGPRGGFYYRTKGRKVYITELEWDIIGKGR